MAGAHPPARGIAGAPVAVARGLLLESAFDDVRVHMQLENAMVVLSELEL